MVQKARKQDTLYGGLIGSWQEGRNKGGEGREWKGEGGEGWSIPSMCVM